MSCTAKHHGTYSAVHHHDCTCPDAQPAYLRRRKMYSVASRRGTPLRVPAHGTIRRVQALQAIGYSMVDLKRMLGYQHACRRSFLPTPSRHRGLVNAPTAAKVDALYRELRWTPATGPHADRLRKMARNRGYASPLAWDNIDDPDEVAQTSLEARRAKERERKRGSRSRINAQNYQRRKAREQEEAA